MVLIDKYTAEFISKTSLYSTYHGKNMENNNPVVIKYFSNDVMENTSVKKHISDYRFIKKEKSEYFAEVYDISFISNGDFNGTAIVYENIEGITLKENFENTKDIRSFLYYLHDIINGINLLHKNDILLNNIYPDMLVVDKNTNRGRIKDIGVFKKFYTEDLKGGNEFIINKIIPYISPEQTDRVDSSVDYRSDFYSLGMTIYEILTGVKAFYSTDILEVIHSHLAKKPDYNLLLENPHVPKKVSEIIFKMILKKTGDRYQTAFGIKKDIERCLKNLENKGYIDDFVPGEKDHFDKLKVSDRLYGRDEELKSLLKSYDNILKGDQEVVLVSGSSGEGKSKLVFEALKIIQKNGSKTIYGKFDQVQKNTPYSAIITALRSLIKKYLMTDYEEVKKFKSKVSASLGKNSQIIIDLIPEMQYIIGKQRSLIKLPVSETANRFNYVLLQFIKIFMNEELPLVIFLDDLQWVDIDSINFIRSMIETPDVKNYFIIGTYRDNEIYSLHPLLKLIKYLPEQNVKINGISLKPLGKKEVSSIVSDTFGDISSGSDYFLDEVYKKTGGNPFFVNQFLYSLYQENIIEHDYEKGVWRWNKDRDYNRGFSDNLSEFMLLRLGKADKDILEVLQIASCIGNKFNLDLLSIVYEHTFEETVMLVGQAIKDGLLIAAETSDFNPDLFIKDKNHNKNISFRFIHDRVQKSVYLSLAEENRKIINLKIGRVLLKKFNEEEIIKNIFDIVNYLNYSIEDIVRRDERKELAWLNYMAGEKAKNTSAYEMSLQYYQYCRMLLDNLSWKENYDLARNLYLSLAEASYLNGDIEKMDKYVDEALKHMKTNYDRCLIYEQKIIGYISSNKLTEAIEICFHVLRKLKVSIPKKIKKINILKEYLYVKLIPFKCCSKIYDKKKDKPIKKGDLNNDLAIRLLLKVRGATYFKSSMGFKYVNLKIINLARKKTKPEEGVLSCLNYMMVLLGSNKIEEAYKYYKRSLITIEKYNIWNLELRGHLLAGTFLLFRFKSLLHCKNLMLYVYKAALRHGNFEYGAYALSSYNTLLLFSGAPLLEVKRAVESNLDRVVSLKQQKIVDIIKIHLAFINGMVGESNFNSQSIVAKDERSIYVFNALVIIYLYFTDRSDEALNYIDNIEKKEYFSIPGVMFSEMLFYCSLIRINTIHKQSKLNRKIFLKRIRSNQKKLNEYVKSSEANFLNKYLIVEGELYRLNGKDLKALDVYDRALELSLNGGFTPEAALLNEIIGKYYESNNRREVALLYMQNAYLLYEEWGVLHKKRSLNRKYSFYSDEKKSDKNDNVKVDEITGYNYELLDLLDLETIIKMSHLISGEIVLDKLIKKIMNILIENAGAESGYFIKVKSDSLFIKAEGSSKNDKVNIFKPTLLSESEKIPESVVNYVYRTKETIILNDASGDDGFKDDPVIDGRGIHSILCFPLVKNNYCSGIVYLENNMTPGAFKLERVEAIKILAVQASISLENAFLYEKAREAEKEREVQYKEVQNQYEKLELMHNKLVTLTEELTRSNKNLEIFKKLSEATSQAFLMLDLHGKLVYLNTAFCKLVGGNSVEELMGTNLFSYYPDKISDELKKVISDLSCGYSKYNGEMQMVKKSGELVPTIQNCFIIKGDDGENLYIAGVITDITDQKRAEEEIKETKVFLEKIFNSLKSILVSTDEKGNITKWNIAAKYYIGLEEGEVLNKKIWDIIPFLKDYILQINAVIESGKSENIDRINIYFDQERCFNLVINSLQLESNNGLVFSFNDITETIKKEEQLKQAQKMDLIGNLAGGLAHDFNNLLGGIIGTVSLLKFLGNKSEKSVVAVKEFDKSINIIENASNRASDLVKQLLTLSRSNEKELKEINLSDSIANVIDICKGTFFKTIDIKTDLSIDEKLYVYADKTQIEQVLLNLCINSSQAMTSMRSHGEQHGGTLTISVNKLYADRFFCESHLEAKEDSFYWVINVRDTGVGIDDHSMNKIFDPFFTTKGKSGGSGLGLSMVYSIVRDHSGFISVYSQRGIGSVFNIFLPVLEVEETNLEKEVSPEVIEGDGTILVIDDEEIIRNIASTILEECGYEVICAEDGYKGVEIYKEKKDNIQMVLLDMAMPKISGKETYIKLKEFDPEIKVLLSSGFKQDSRVTETIKLGINDFLQKPFSMIDLCAKVYGVINNQT